MDKYNSRPSSSAGHLKRNAELADLNQKSSDAGEREGWTKRETVPPGGKKTKGRVKIKMEFIDNKLRRYTTFSKRKTGIMKKAYELSTLTGTQVMLLVASETGHVYTFATKKLQPMITSEAGKALIQTCLHSPEEGENQELETESVDQRMSAVGFEETELHYDVEDKEDNDQFEQECDDDLIDEQSDEESSDLKPTNLSMHSHNPSPPYSSSEPTFLRRRPPTAAASSLQRLPPAVIPSSSQGRPPPAAPSSLQRRLSPSAAANTTSNVNSSQPIFDKPMLSSSKPLLMSPEMRAQLGYTSLLAQATSSHRLLANQLPFLLAQPIQTSNLAQSNPTSIAELLPREPLPQFAVADTQPTQSPENLSLNKHDR